MEAEKVNHRSKHVGTRCNFVKDMIREGDIVLEYCETENMVADILTQTIIDDDCLVFQISRSRAFQIIPFHTDVFPSLLSSSHFKILLEVIVLYQNCSSKVGCSKDSKVSWNSN
jgi:hypothetical protein